MDACPGTEQSAGKNYSRRCPKGNRQMRRVLNQAANAALVERQGKHIRAQRLCCWRKASVVTSGKHRVTRTLDAKNEMT
jgi:transposase